MDKDIIIPGVCTEAVKALKDAERGRLILAAMIYRSEGRELSLCGGERYLWPEFKAAIDKDRAEEVALRLMNSEKGKKGGRPKDCKKPEKAAAFDEKPEVFTRKPPLSSPLPLPPTPPISNPPIIPPKEQSRARREAEFAQFWQAYPRKVGKQAALKAFLKTKVPVETLLSALEQQKKTEQWREDGGRYIPHPATWLNQGRWEDEITPAVGQQEETQYTTAPRSLGVQVIDGEEVAIFEKS